MGEWLVQAAGDPFAPRHAGNRTSNETWFPLRDASRRGISETRTFVDLLALAGARSVSASRHSDFSFRPGRLGFGRYFAVREKSCLDKGV